MSQDLRDIYTLQWMWRFRGCHKNYVIPRQSIQWLYKQTYLWTICIPISLQWNMQHGITLAVIIENRGHWKRIRDRQNVLKWGLFYFMFYGKKCTAGLENFQLWQHLIFNFLFIIFCWTPETILRCLENWTN